jgi:iron complex transport system substrate-binding protein
MSVRAPSPRAPRAARLGLLLALWAWPAAAPAQGVPQRIVSLAPSVTEALFEAGLGSRVVGVTSHCRFPPAVLALPRVGGYLTPSYEALVALRPDLVVTLAEHADVEPRLAALQLPVLRVDHGSLEGIVRSILTLGERCGVEAAAGRAARALQRDLTLAREIVGARARPRVLVLISRSEDFRQFHAAAPGTVYDDLIVQAGGRNALMSRAVRYPTLSIEGVMRLDPDAIVEFAAGAPDAGALRRQWDALDSVRAVRSGRVYVFTEEFLSVPGPRFARFAGTIARALGGSR